MAATVTHPTAVVSSRREPFRNRLYAAKQIVRGGPQIPEVEIQSPPVRYSEFYGVGHRVPQKPDLYLYHAPEQWAAVQAPHFAFPTVPGARVIGSQFSMGGQLPVRERSNIAEAKGTSYGSLSEVNPIVGYSPNYVKLV